MENMYDPKKNNFWLSKDRITELNKLYNALIEENNQLFQLVNKLQKENDFPELENKNYEIFSADINLIPIAAKDSYDIKDFNYLEIKYQAKVDSLEIFLCNIRCKLLPGLLDNSINLKDDIDIQIKFHEKHRYENFDQWVEWLEEKQEKYYQYIKEDSEFNLNEEEYTYYKELYIKTVNEIERVEKLHFKDYLYDLTLFGNNPEDFTNSKEVI